VHAVNKIIDTTQLFLDVYTDRRNNVYVRPQKVWNRGSETMFGPHTYDPQTGRFCPILDGVKLSRFYQTLGKFQRSSEEQYTDSWDRFFNRTRLRSESGLDISEGMLAVMREKLEAEGLEGRVSVGQGDCEAMGFDGARFDRAAIAFGIRNFEHREKALKEILRVLKPGGKLVILELSVPSNPVIRWFYKLYFTGILPVIGGKVSGDKAAYRYLPASVLQFPGKKEWMETMRTCGYAGVRHKAFTLGICRMYVGVKP